MSNTAQTPAQDPKERKKLMLERQEKVKGQVMTFIDDTMQGNTQIFPKNYNPRAALMSAWLYLKELVDKDGNPALEVCSPASVQQALLKMLTNGLSVTKTQCYFIPYAGKLDCSISYHGKELIAKRAGGVSKVFSSAIYEGDEFAFEVDNETGLKKITKHTQTLESIGDGTKIKGAYAIVDFEDGRREVTIMTKAQILNAWNQRKGNGLTPAHTKFTDEMASKTVRNRALKHAANTSDDAHLFNDDHEEERPEGIQAEIKTKANSETLDFDDHEDVTPILEQPKENPVKDLKKQAEPVAEPQVKAGEQIPAAFA